MFSRSASVLPILINRSHFRLNALKPGIYYRQLKPETYTECFNQLTRFTMLCRLVLFSLNDLIYCIR